MSQLLEYTDPRQRKDPDNAPDLVISADTIVLAHAAPPTTRVDTTADLYSRPDVLEKPLSKVDNLRMILDLVSR